MPPPYPQPEPIPVPQKYGECGQKKVSPKILVSPDGGLRNAVLRLRGEWAASPDKGSPGQDYVLDQVGCEFRPHVMLIPKGGTIQILNSDGFLHNVRAFNTDVEMLFNDAMPGKGEVLRKTFSDPGLVVLRCGLHEWMHALVVVQEHPYYALTDEQGFFRISGIPDGRYTLSVWHESWGELEREITPESGPVVMTYESR